MFGGLPHLVDNHLPVKARKMGGLKSVIHKGLLFSFPFSDQFIFGLREMYVCIDVKSSSHRILKRPFIYYFL